MHILEISGLVRIPVSYTHLSISMSGGGSKNNYRASYTYLDRTGIVRDNWMKRHSFQGTLFLCNRSMRNVQGLVRLHQLGN